MGCTLSSTTDDRGAEGHGYPIQTQPVIMPVQLCPVPMQQNPGYGPAPPAAHQPHWSYPQPMRPLTDPATELVQFVLNTPLEPTPRSAPFLQLPYKPSNYSENADQADVVDGSVVAFTSRLTGQNRQDVKNATLFAQLAASKKHDRFTNTEDWYKQYVYVLEKIGFVIQNFNFTEYYSKSQTFTMDRAVIDIMKAATTKNGMVIINASLDALGKLPGDDRSVTLFNNRSTKMKNGNFQIGVADQAANGDVILTTGAFYFDAKQHQTRFLWFTWSSATITVFSSCQTMVLNEEVYAAVRATVLLKLGKQAQDLVSGIEL